jgi:hypothetical protein
METAVRQKRMDTIKYPPLSEGLYGVWRKANRDASIYTAAGKSGLAEAAVNLTWVQEAME